jgi:hypothetical protein
MNFIVKNTFNDPGFYEYTYTYVKEYAGWHCTKKKKPFVETKGSNDCLPYEGAKVTCICYGYVS